MPIAPTLQDEDRQGELKGEVEPSLALINTMAPPLEDDLGGDGVEHGDHGILPSPMEAHGVEMVEHGNFPSTKEAHGDEKVEPTPLCFIDELVPIPCEHESHLAHLSESDSELSDFHPICEFECFRLEDMSDTQSELREVDDRSMEDIAFANTLTSPSFVSSYVALGSTEDEFPLMETMYMVHEDDDISPCLLQDGHVDHMDPPTSTTPTSNESAYKGNNIGVDDAMIPLVDMMTYECMHDLDDTFATSHATFTFPCDALLDNIVDHVELLACDNMVMPCYESFTFSPIACNMSNNCSFPCIACNDNDNDACVVTTLPNNCSFHRFVDNNDNMLNMFCSKCLQYSTISATKMLNTCSFQCLVCHNVNMLVNEIAPIALSNFGDFAYIHVEHVPMFTPHIHHIYYDALLNANGDVQKKWTIMMDDVFIYHAHTFFALPIVCVGTRKTR
jgi:hypothetical protein